MLGLPDFGGLHYVTCGCYYVVYWVLLRGLLGATMWFVGALMWSVPRRFLWIAIAWFDLRG